MRHITHAGKLKLGAPDSYRLTTGDYYHTKNCPAGTDPQGGYHNAGNYAATMSLKSALIQSSNTYFVNIPTTVTDLAGTVQFSVPPENDITGTRIRATVS